MRLMSLDEFLDTNGIAMAVVEQFDDYAVDVAVPPGWEPFQSPPATRVGHLARRPQRGTVLCQRGPDHGPGGGSAGRPRLRVDIPAGERLLCGGGSQTGSAW